MGRPKPRFCYILKVCPNKSTINDAIKKNFKESKSDYFMIMTTCQIS